jgi:lipopolysaccharide transport system ATP-binding protein
MPGIAITAENIGKMYRIFDKPQDRLKDGILWRFGRRYGRDFWALRDVSLEVRKGESVGIIGRNGSGKSTLLQIIAGTLQATTGNVQVNGRVAALLELGSGFNPDYTGRENVYMNAAILGLSKEETDAKFDAIASFADIGQFLEQPVKTYSSGMMVRLAFAVQTAVDPDILIVDEALAVGDGVFIHRCMNRFHELREAGTTVLFVSHDMTAMRLLTSNVLWLDDGQSSEFGPTTGVVDNYLSFISNQRVIQQNKSSTHVRAVQSMPSQYPLQPMATAEHIIPNIDKRLGDQSCTFMGVGVYDDDMNPVTSIQHGEVVILRVTAKNNKLAPNTPCLFGFFIRNSKGIDIASSNSEIEKCPIHAPPPGHSFNVQVRFRLPLLHPDIYSLTIALSHHSGVEWVDADSIYNVTQVGVTGRVRCHVLLTLIADYSTESVGQA